MTNELRDQIASSFVELKDPRQPINQAHLFLDLLVISICAILCGADDWEAVADYAVAKKEWLSTFLELPNGPPAHDTFWRVFRTLDAEQFQSCFLKWMVLPWRSVMVRWLLACCGKQCTTETRERLQAMNLEPLCFVRLAKTAGVSPHTTHLSTAEAT